MQHQKFICCPPVRRSLVVLWVDIEAVLPLPSVPSPDVARMWPWCAAHRKNFAVTFLLVPWGSVSIRWQSLISSNYLPALYDTPKFITVPTTDHDQSQPLATQIQSTPSLHVATNHFHSSLHQLLDLSTDLFPLCFTWFFPQAARGHICKSHIHY